ncbi:MFS transporter [Streptomyces sp. NPDC059467]|uniref:MFS transporter n=1 Tax=Streptomyces sp. NPDC059467 TaxID=3346844 RepID=UPI0036AAE900
MLALFVAYQRRRTRTDGSPLIELSLFGYKSFTGGLLVNLLFMGGVIGFFLVFTLYMQVGLGYSVLRSGLTGIPWGAVVPVFAGVGAGVLAPKVGRPVMQIGLLLAITALVWLVWIVGREDVTSLKMAPALAVGGAGMGLVVAPMLDFTLADVPIADAGSASGIYNSIQQIGSAIGIAGIGALFFAQTGSTQPSPATYTPPFQHARVWCRSRCHPIVQQTQTINFHVNELILTNWYISPTGTTRTRSARDPADRAGHQKCS